MKTMYKVLEKGRRSPYQHFAYVPNKEYVCKDFDDDATVDCSRGFYATGLDGLCYAYRPGKSIYEVRVGGREVCFNQFKHRFEKIIVGKRLAIPEVKERMLSKSWDWNIKEATFPVHPFEKTRKRVTNADKELLKSWASVWDSVEASVRASVWASVWDSVGDSVGAYISSLFPNIQTWKHIDHKPGKNPFQSCIDLWRSGLVPNFDGTTWRLNSKNGILYELKKENESE